MTEKPVYPEPDLSPLTAQEAAERLGLTDSAVRRLCIAGKIKAVRTGKSWAIPIDQISAALARPKRGRPSRPTIKKKTA